MRIIGKSNTTSHLNTTFTFGIFLEFSGNYLLFWNTGRICVFYLIRHILIVHSNIISINGPPSEATLSYVILKVKNIHLEII